MQLQSERPKRQLILDFDGVMVETEPLHFLCWNRAFAELIGFEISGDYHQLVGLSLDGIFDLWCRAAPGGPVQLSLDMRDRLLTRKTELYFEIGQETLVPAPGLLPLVHHLHALNWYVSIVSRSLRRRLMGTLALLNLPAQFDLILAYEDAVDPSTDRKRHDRAASPFGIDPANCIVIEDSASGVRDARDSGIGTVIGITSSLAAADLVAAGAHEIIDSLPAAQRFVV